MPRNTGRSLGGAVVAVLLIITTSCSYAEEIAKAGPTETSEVLAEAEAAVDTETVEVGGATEEREETPETAISSASLTPAPSNDAEAQLAAQPMAIVNVPVGLNLRTGPGVDFEVIVGVTKDRIVTATGNVAGEWTEVEVDGDTGWMASVYLAPTSP